MSDDIQAVPPADNGLPRSRPAYDRFGEINVRKPGAGGCWVSISLAATFAIILVVVGWFFYRMAGSGGPNPVPVRVGPAADSRKSLEGTWVATAMVFNGDTVDPEVAKVNLLIRESDFVLVLPVTTLEGEWKSGLDSQPKQLDLLPKDDLKIQAIYRIDGDTMTLCFITADRPRPTDFAARKGSQHNGLS